jgi:endonuclease/exonuclease/phosphatase family metal-dependent hydrolase
MFTVATLNLLDHQARPAERFPLIVAGLAQEWPDLVALQEVSASREQGERLAAALNAAAGSDRAPAYRYAQQTNLRRPDLTVGILARHPIRDQAWVDLQGQGRVAFAVTTEIDGQRLAFVTTHLFWEVGPAGEQARHYQAGVLADWVARTFAGTPTIVGGDFNAVPDGLTYAYLTERWPRRPGPAPRRWPPPPRVGRAPSTICSRRRARPRCKRSTRACSSPRRRPTTRSSIPRTTSACLPAWPSPPDCTAPASRDQYPLPIILPAHRIPVSGYILLPPCKPHSLVRLLNVLKGTLCLLLSRYERALR